MKESQHDKIIRQVGALLNVTPENATDQEALNAAKLARELIDKHQIDLNEVKGAQKNTASRLGYERVVFEPVLRRFRFHEIWRLFGLIAAYCDTAILITEGGKGRKDTITIIGEEVDRQFTFNLLARLRAAMDAQHVKAVAQGMVADTQSSRDAFMHGATISIGQRIDIMMEQRAETLGTTGNELVVSKKSDLDNYIEELYDVTPKVRSVGKKKVRPETYVGHQLGGEIPILDSID